MVNREKLDEIILKNDTKNWWKPDLFKEYTQQLLPKELEILTSPPPENNNYNCFLYILGLSKNEEVLKDSGGFIYDIFFQKLIEENILQYTDNPKNGDYIFYKDLENYPDMITHAGILKEDSVVSKWSWGPLFRHAIWDVPASYGNDISYVKAISPKEALSVYWKYSKFNKKPQ